VTESLPLENLPAQPVAQVVLLPSPAGLPESLTYAIPNSLRDAVREGVPVVVPLGGREQLGYVLSVGTLAETEETLRLRPIRTVPRPEPAFDSAMIRLLQWLAREYRCSLADALPLAVPERYGVELQPVIALGEWDGTLPPRVGLLTRQALTGIFTALTAAGGSITKAQLEDAVQAPTLPAALRRAKAEGWIRLERVLLPPKVQARTISAFRVAPAEAPAIVTEPESEPPKKARRETAQQRAVLEFLDSRGGAAVPLRELCAAVNVTEAVVRRLVSHGLLERTEVAVRRAPRGYGEERDRAPVLSPFQGSAAAAIDGAMRRGTGEGLLLFGVTGSGKTEVYLHAIERARADGRTALLLVPEISLTAQVAAAVRRRLGDQVAILHSALSEGERFDEWERVRRGEADVVVGPRSALFAPLKDPALIVLDEEHDSSYKQGSTPRYHARQTALERVRISGGCVVLGSATPSVETYHAALGGEYQLLELPERVRQRPLPEVEIVDLREESKKRPGTVFGQRLEDAMRQRLESGEQVILFLNRRGFSAFLLCRDCGFVPHCPNCAVSLTLHRQQAGMLLCHHCDYTRRPPTHCERCLGPRVKQFGIGTQRVEEAVRALFPRARVERLDRDALSTRDAHTRIVGQMRAGEIDVLVGTQMVTKGFDFPGVTLVGVVTADVALNIPDFRAAERAFQLLTQVSGRAGRGDQPGEVVVQTFNPEHPSVQAAARHDYRGFFGQEIRSRKELGFPPFGFLARAMAFHEEDSVARSRIEAAAALFRPIADRGEVSLLGPTTCPLSRVNNRYRWHLLLKAASRTALGAVLDAAWPEIQQKVGGVVLDVGPVDLL
jgi:primosomal protein N' (replication factor Y)